MKTILLTGATGFFGLNYYLQNKKFKILPIINKRKINLKNSVKLDLLNKDLLKKLIIIHKPDIILHAAALTNIEKCEKNKLLAKNINVNITKNIIEISKKFKIKLIFLSTDHLFQKKKLLFKENDKVEPINIYAKTKKKAEDLIKNNLKNYIILRTNFFGWGPEYKKSFSDIIINNLKTNKETTLFKDVFFNPVNIEYLCKIIDRLIIKDISGTFNVSSNEPISKLHFGILLSKIFGLKKKFIIPIKIKEKNITKRPKYMSLSNKKLIKTLNIPINELGIKKQILSLRKSKINKKLKKFNLTK